MSSTHAPTTQQDRQPRLIDGCVPLGYHDDGTPATWRLYTDGSMWGGTIVSYPGDGGSNELAKISLSALYSGVTSVIHIDGEDSVSLPGLWQAAAERYAADEVDQALQRITAMCDARTQMHIANSQSGFEPRSDYPGILVVVSAGGRVITTANAMRWGALAAQGRKIGIAPIFQVEDDALLTFRSASLRRLLRAGNAVAFTASVYDPRVRQDLWRDPHALRPPAFPITYGASVNPARYTPQSLPSQVVAAGHDGDGTDPRDIRTLDDWFVDAPRTALDAATAAAADACTP